MCLPRRLLPSPAVPPRVSVIVPVYNRPAYVRQAIDSALAQECPGGFEVVVVDGDDGRWLGVRQAAVIRQVLAWQASLVVRRDRRRPYVRIPGGIACCFRGCRMADDVPSLRLEISVPPDTGPVTAWAHETCFVSSCTPSVEPDRPEDHGHIPGKARCVFCGRSLPAIGRHPYSFDVGDYSPPRRFWSHAECILDRLLLSAAQGT